MKLFLDTEFTSLEKPKLISLAIVSEDGQEFYRELTTGWKLVECTMFVLGWVLPHLSDGQVGHKLNQKLDKHLDLIQWECDADNQFSKAKEQMLEQALQGDVELLEHLDYLAKNYGSTDLRVGRNKYVHSRIGGYQVENLLSGEQAKPRDQVRQDLLKWLGHFPAFEICCDSDYDPELLMDLIDKPFDWRLIENRAVRNPDWQLHHALSDAKAMKDAFLLSERVILVDKYGEITIEDIDVEGQTYAINKTYGYVAEYRNDDGRYWLIKFADIPEAASQAICDEEIEKNATDALEACIAAYLKLKKELP